MKQHKILVLPGDGIGKEITQWGKKVIEATGEKFGYSFTFEEGLIGHSSIQATGEPFTDETLERCKQVDAILLGAVGDPMYDNNPALKVRPEQGLLKIRSGLGLFANLRPIQLFDELIDASSLKREVIQGVDILFFRELTGDIYFGKPRERRDNGESAVDTMLYSKEEVRRVAKMAFEAASKRRKKLCSVDKANVLECSRLWREVVQEMTKDYPDVEVEHMFVDNAAMQLIKNPRQFDVVLTGNIFGDILTDEASQIAGSLGMLASASVGNIVGLYEPIHGSAPDIAGKGIANPIATILSTALMFEITFKDLNAAAAIFKAVDQTLKQGYRTGDIADERTEKSKILGTDAMGEKVLENLKSL